MSTISLVNQLLLDLKICSKSRDFKTGKLIHEQATHLRLHLNTFIGNALMKMYFSCGCINSAQEVFKSIQKKDVVSWNILITGYVENGEMHLALECYSRMKTQPCPPDARTFVSLIKACAAMACSEKSTRVDRNLVKLESLRIGREFHVQAAEHGYVSNIFITNTLIDMYSKSGSLVDARRVFDNMSYRTVVSWNAWLLGCAENGEPELALEYFSSMDCHPDSRTFVAVLKSFSVISSRRKVGGVHAKALALEACMAVHAWLARGGVDGDVFVRSSLVDLYAKSGSLTDAENVFYRNVNLSSSVVTWNALMLGYVENGEAELALELFSSLQPGKADALSYVAGIKSCTLLANREETSPTGYKLVSLERGMAIHSRAESVNLHFETPVLNTLVDMYTRCGSLADSCRLFQRAVSRNDPVLWNTLLLGAADKGDVKLASELFFRMLNEQGASVDARTCSAALKACGGLVSVLLVRRVHGEAHRRGFLEEEDVVLLTCVVDAYSRSGNMLNARLAAESVGVRDLATWNALLGGFSRQGDVKETVSVLDRMVGEGLKPDCVSFVSVLTACSRGGCVEEGRKVFERMLCEFGVEAEAEHLHCMVDLFGRANRLEEGLSFWLSFPPVNRTL